MPLLKNLTVVSLVCFFFMSCESMDVYDEPVSVFAENEMFRLTITADTDVVTEASATPFEVSVSRLKELEIREDSRMIGTWDIYLMTVDGENVNVAQLPTTYIFYKENTYSKTTTNTITNEDSYANGSWTLDTNGTLTMIEAGTEKTVTASFDTESTVVPQDGFMTWAYTEGSQSVTEVYQKADETDESTIFESSSYLSVIASGNAFIDAYTQESALDINIIVGEMEGDEYQFSALFTPGVGVDVDVITATLENEDYELLTVQLPIKVRPVEGSE